MSSKVGRLFGLFPTKARITIIHVRTSAIYRSASFTTTINLSTSLRMLSIQDGSKVGGKVGILSKKIEFVQNLDSGTQDEYTRCIRDLNSLQSNTQTLALAKYKRPEDILPLFKAQLELSGIKVDDLNRLNIIHVSGTKGKGSTCAFVESIIRINGKKTGFYNSPHLVKVTERIRVDGKPIDDGKFSKYFRKVYDTLLKKTSRAGITMPSYFSFLTILSFHIFLEEKVDCAVIEVGIGGEYDPTNIIQHPIACGISTLDYDHTNILGNSMKDIAWSKAGILKKDVPLFVVEDQPEEALDIVKKRCIEKGSPLFICRPLVGLLDTQLGIQGSVQIKNASLACQLSKYLLKKVFNYEFTELSYGQVCKPTYINTSISQLPTTFRDALTTCTWPGRCQVLRFHRSSFFLDGAHTRKSMKNCLDWFIATSEKEDPTALKILMINIIGDRNKYAILSQLCEYDNFEFVIFSTNRINSAGDTPQSETFVNIQGASSEKSMENVRKNAETWNTLCKERKTKIPNIIIMSNTRDSIELIHEKSKLCFDTRYHVLVTGSLHFVGAVSETLSILGEILN